jgi:GAG-pre-integrase domain
VLKEGQLMTIREAGGVYTVITLSLTSTDSPTLSTPSSRFTRSISASKWLQERLLHRRLGHLNQEYIRQLPGAAKQDFRIRFSKKEFCETCVLAKQRRKPNKEPTERAKRPGQRIHADLYGEGYTFASKEL